MNANHTAITVMKRAAAEPDKGDLSVQGGREGRGTWQVAGRPYWACSYISPHRESPTGQRLYSLTTPWASLVEPVLPMAPVSEFCLLPSQYRRK